MMRYVLFLIGMIFTSTLQAQVSLINIDQLQLRMERGRDTTYLVNFWATWCTPCIEELPAFEKLNAQKKEKPIKVILLSLDFKSKLQTVVVPFVKKNQLKSEVFVLNETDQQKFIDRVNKNWSGAIPATWFYNSDRKFSSFYEKQLSHKELTEILHKMN